MADNDRNSKVDDGTWSSFLKTGTLTLHRDGMVSVEWDPLEQILTHMAESGRGGELSELIVFNGKLYTVDDKTGIRNKLHN